MISSLLVSRLRKRWRVSDRTSIRSTRALIRTAFRVLLSKFYLLSCTRVGSLPRTWGRPRIINKGTLILGDRVRILSTVVPSELVVRDGARLEIGDHVYINYGASISAYQSIRIGSRCTVGTYAIITDNDQHDLVDLGKLPPSKPVTLEDDVWIGDRVIILKGVTIGKKSAIGAGSVVTRDIPPYSVAAGNPARVLRQIEGPSDGDRGEETT